MRPCEALQCSRQAAVESLEQGSPKGPLRNSVGLLRALFENNLFVGESLVQAIWGVGSQATANPQPANLACVCKFNIPLSMGFSKQEYWSRLPFSSPGDLPHPGIEPGSPMLQADSLPLTR